MASNWSAEDGNRAYSQRVDRDRRRAEALRQARAAGAAGRRRRAL